MKNPYPFIALTSCLLSFPALGQQVGELDQQVGESAQLGIRRQQDIPHAAMIGSTAFLPLRAVVDKFGGTLKMEEHEGINMISIRTDEKTITFVVDERIWFDGDIQHELAQGEAAPFVYNGVTYFYANPLSEILGIRLLSGNGMIYLDKEEKDGPRSMVLGIEELTLEDPAGEAESTMSRSGTIVKRATDPPAIATDTGSIYLPLRVFTDFFGGTMQVDKKTGVVTVQGKNKVNFIIGEKTWREGNEKYNLKNGNLPAFVYNGITYLCSEALLDSFEVAYKDVNSSAVKMQRKTGNTDILALTISRPEAPKSEKKKPAPRPLQPTNPPYIPGISLTSNIGTLGNDDSTNINVTTPRNFNRAFSHLKITKETEKGLVHIRFYFSESSGATAYTNSRGFLVRFFDSNGSYLSSINTERLKYDFTDTSYVGWKSFTYQVNKRDLRDAQMSEFGFSPFKN